MTGVTPAGLARGAKTGEQSRTRSGPRDSSAHPTAPFLDQISRAARDDLTAHGARLEIGAEREIFGAAEAMTHGGILLRGRARVFLTALDGRELTLRYAEPGSMVGFVAGGMDGARVRAISDCSVLAFSQDDLDALSLSDHSVALALVAELRRRLASIVDLLSSRAFAAVDRRLATWLIELDEAPPGASDLPHVVRATQQALADDLGTSREVVNRLLQRFERDGLVDLRVGKITLRDLERLRSLGSLGKH